MQLPLIDGFDKDSPFFFLKDNNAPLLMKDMAKIVTQLIPLLGDGAKIINLCENRVNFVSVFLAALADRKTTVLTPGSMQGAIEAVIAEHPDALPVSDKEKIIAPFPGGILIPDFTVISGGARQNQNDHSSTASEDGILQFSHRHESIHLSSLTLEEGFPAAVLYTSGSTGKPSANEKPWGSLVHGARTLATERNMRNFPDRAILATVPPHHMFGFESSVMLSIQNGIPVFEGQPLLPQDIKATIQRKDKRLWVMTTPLQLKAVATEQVQLPLPVDGVISSTMPLARTHAAKIEELWSTEVYEIYGCTEAGMIAMRRTVQDTNWKPVNGVELRQQQEHFVASGGHIPIPASLMDLLVLEKDGSFSIEGRSSDLVKIGGKRMSLQAMNRILVEMDEVLDGAFYFDETGRRSRTIGLIVPGSGYDPERLKSLLKKQMDPVFIPRQFFTVDHLPREKSGKLPLDNLKKLIDELINADQTENPDRSEYPDQTENPGQADRPG